MVRGVCLCRVGCSGSSAGYVSDINQVSDTGQRDCLTPVSKAVRCINMNHIWPLCWSNSFRKPWRRVLFSPEENNSVRCECLFNRSPAGTSFYAISPSAKTFTASFCPRCFASTAVWINYLCLSPHSEKNDSQSAEPGFLAQLAKYSALFQSWKKDLCLYNPKFTIVKQKKST